eukprot:EG_transcript_32617
MALAPPLASPRSALSPRPLEGDRRASTRSGTSAEMQGASLSLERQNMDLLQHTEPPLMEYDGVELLRQVFDSMAKNGKIMMDQLPFLLAGAEVQATAEQVQEAIDEFIPDADDDEALLDFDQVQTLYNQLVQTSVDNAADALLLAAEEERKATVFQRLWQWLQQKNRERRVWQSQFQVHIKPTTRLLL